MILLILFSFVFAYILSVLFFRKMAKENNLKGTFMFLLGFVPIVNFIVASVMFVFNNETSKRFFELALSILQNASSVFSFMKMQIKDRKSYQVLSIL